MSSFSTFDDSLSDGHNNTTTTTTTTDTDTPILSRTVSQPSLPTDIPCSVHSSSASVIEPPIQRKRAATVLTFISAPLRRSSHALHSALTRGVTRASPQRAAIPKIVLASPDGRSRTIYLKD